jgi:hypothetical protein
MDGLQMILLCIGLRHVHCPHCFEVRIRPYGLLKPLSFPVWGVARLFRTLMRV